MSELLGWFVHQPLRLAAIGGVFLVLSLFVRGVPGRAASRGRVLMLPAAFFVAFAAWEWLVTTRSPEANIRVDLLLLWPAALAAVAWSLYRLLRRD